MGRGSRVGRIALATAVAVAGTALAAPAASATFHLMKVREVFPGTAAASHNDAFIELQMYVAGQNLVGGHPVTTYAPGGGTPHTYVIPGNVPNGESQRTILISGIGVGDSSTDFQDSGLGPAISSTGGAVCFPDATPPDCVSWGNFTGNASLPAPGAGTPVAPTGIPDGFSIERSIAPNCPTLLEDADDTNDSLVDFALATPSPRLNATPPTETPCAGAGNPGGGPNTTITKGPKKKTKKKKATFEFTSDTPGATFECSLDGKPFTPCTSPHEVKVKKGKHSFEVRAVLNGTPDGSPAEQDWKVKKKKRK
jgi:hypothetical protein